MTIGVGVAGCGYWGSKILPAVSGTEGLKLVAVCDPKEGRREWVRQNHPGVEVAAGFEELVAMRGVEAVWLATPAPTHAALAREALGLGRHVLVEKPLALSAAEAYDLVDAAHRRGLTLHTGHIFLHGAAVASMRALLDQGAAGDLCYVTCERINPGPPGSPVSVLWDLAVHDVSILLHLTGRRPVAASARGGSWRRAGLAEAAIVTLDLTGGLTAQVHVSWMSSLKTRVMRVFGSDATLVYDDLADPPVRWIGAAADNRPGASDTSAVPLAYGPGEVREFRPSGPEPLRAQCAAFRDSIRSGRGGAAAPNDGRLALPVIETLEAADRSLASGGTRVEIGQVVGAGGGGGR